MMNINIVSYNDYKYSYQNIKDYHDNLFLWGCKDVYQTINLPLYIMK